MGKYWEIAKEAYRHEKKQASKKISVDQKDFLPAALELLETPASPMGRGIIWLICTFFIITLLWSMIGKVDVIAIAQGKVAPIGQTKIVQSFENGVIHRIHVENGSHVNAGDILIELDSTSSTADITNLEREFQTASLAVKRNKWLLENLTRAQLQKFELPTTLSKEEARIQDILATSKLNEYRATQGAFLEQRKEREAEILVTSTELEKLQTTLPLLEEQVIGMKNLAEEGVTARFQYLQYQEKLVGRRKDILIARNQIKQIMASVRSVKMQKRQHMQQYRSQLTQELANANDKKIAFQQELIKAKNRQIHHNITSPVNGVVQQLKTHTLGGVVAASDPLMAIVPKERKLQAEVNILNKDIGFIEVGQEVHLKLESFQFTKYGVLLGKIISIDHDAVHDERLGLIYPSRISLMEDSIMVNDKQVPISAGMSLSAEIKTGKRKLIEFILSPLLRYKNESLRER